MLDERSYEARIQQINRCIPNAFNYRRYLYIGASKGRTSFLEMLTKKDTTVLEIHKANIVALQSRPEFSAMTFINGDIRDIDIYQWKAKEKCFDVSLWYHGPEHILINEIFGVLKNIESITKHLVILGCPWGRYQQGEYDGNIYETHLCSLYPENFQMLGYKTDALGQIDVMGSNILSWKFFD